MVFHRFNSRQVVALAVALLFAPALLGPESLYGAGDSELAEEIIDAAGVNHGIIVHAGCGDGRLTVQLRRSDTALVQGLERSPEKVAAARARVRAENLAGAVVINHWQGEQLPYIDHLVNLLVVEEGVQVPEAEILRVLAPQGVALLRQGDGWRKVVKPRPDAMDVWTHYMYDSTGNAVSHDTLVGPPEHLQWVGDPRWARHHDHIASLTALVAAETRLFYVFDEGSTASITLPSQWRLIARDAFNGVVLWKRDLPDWWTRFTPLKSGPAQLPRKLVATSEHVYLPLGLNAPVSQLDAATGKTLQTYQDTENTWELLFNEGLLYAVRCSTREEEQEVQKQLFVNRRTPGNPFNERWKGWDRELVVIDPRTGEVAWRLSATILPGTLAVAGDSAFFHNGHRMVAVDKKTGQEQWTSKPVAAIDIAEGIPTGFMPSLVVDQGVVVFAGGQRYQEHMKARTDKMVAFCAQDGRILWEAAHYPSGYQSPEDLLVANGTVLAPFTTWLTDRVPEENKVAGVDLLTGELVHHEKPDVEDPVWFIHHRCHPSKATVKYLLTSKEGVEFVDLENWDWKIHHWVRGGCIYGILPANGLLYTPMHACACSADTKLCGFNALAAPASRRSPVDARRHELTEGPAFGRVEAPARDKPGDWPTYRHDAARCGVASCPAPASLETVWEADIGGKPSAPVVAGGRVYVAAVDQHRLHVLEEDTGRELWNFTAEGRIDSPPTIDNGMVLFGSRDGCVYCLRASDGALVWRFRPVAEDRRLMAQEQIESVWPVHGSILIRDGEAWFVAGRSEFLDGGLHIFRLKPETGEVLSHATFDGKAPDGRVLTGAEEKRLVGLPDVLSASEDRIFMRAGVIRLEGDTIRKKLLPEEPMFRYGLRGRTEGNRLAREAHPHLFSSYGFLDDSWMHRSYWVFNDTYGHRHSYYRTGATRPAGRILVCDETNVYGFGRQQRYFNWTTPLEYCLFARAKAGNWEQALIWSKNAPGLLARGLVLAGETLFAAGPPDLLDETRPGIRFEDAPTRQKMEEQAEALAGLHGGLLMALSKADGELKQQIDLDSPPVFDGMIVANGRLFLAMENGKVQCRGRDPSR